MKKAIYSFVVVMVFAGNTRPVFAQTKEEDHSALTSHHNKIKEHSGAIANGQSKTKEQHLQHASGATKNLEEAKKVYEVLKKSIPRDHTEVVMPHLTAIETYHVQAASNARALNEELKKVPYNEAKVMEHAKNLHETIDKAEKEHQALKEKTKK
jgi:hypothetical protein